MKVIGFAGFSGSGKTTLVERLIPALKLRGLRVSVVKHAHHKFDIDHPGKDTYRHREAGAFEVVVASDQRLALMREFEQPAQLTVHHLIAELYEGVDWVLVEGFKDSNLSQDRGLARRIGQAGALSRRRLHRGDRHRLAGAAARGHPAPRAGFERSGSSGAVAHGQSAPLRLPPGDVFMNAPRPALRPLDEALAELLGHAQPLEGTETVSTFDADGRVLAQDVVSGAAGAAAGQQLHGRLCGAQQRDRRRWRVAAGQPAHSRRQRCRSRWCRAAQRASSPARPFPPAPMRS